MAGWMAFMLSRFQIKGHRCSQNFIFMDFCSSSSDNYFLISPETYGQVNRLYVASVLNQRPLSFSGLYFYVFLLFSLGQSFFNLTWNQWPGEWALCCLDFKSKAVVVLRTLFLCISVVLPRTIIFLISPEHFGKNFLSVYSNVDITCPSIKSRVMNSQMKWI